MAGIKIPVEATFNQGDLTQQLQQFQQSFNKLGQTIAQANKIKFDPISKASIDDVKKLEASFQSLLRVNGDLRGRLKNTGQAGASFFGLDWSKLYQGELQRGWQMQRVFQHVAGGAARFEAPRAGGGGAILGGVARQVAGAGLNAMGPAGRVADGALTTGMSGGLKAGLAGLGGGLAALAISKIFGAVSEGVGAVIKEEIRDARIRRQLGSVGVGFHALKEGVRDASSQMGLSFEQGQELVAQYIRRGNVSNRADLAGVMGEVTTAGNLARSFGIDQGASVGAFGAMRNFGAIHNDQDARKMALLIGEGIAKSGAFAQSEEYLKAISSYTEVSARAGMSTPNLQAYMAQLTGMVGAKIPGLDVQGSAALLGRMNSTFAGGGGAGEAGQNFMNAALSRGGKLDPMDAAFLREQGMFGTFKTTFGDDKSPTMLRKWYKKNGLALPDVGDQDATGFELVRRRLESSYGGSPQSKKLMANAMANFYGINNTQAAAMLSIDPAHLGGLGQRLGRLGINLKDVNATGISEMAQIEASNKSGPEKDKAIREAAEHGMEKSDGDRNKDQLNELKNLKSILADDLVPPIRAMKDGILWMAGGNKGMTLDGIRQKMYQAGAADRAKGVLAVGDEKQRAVLEQMEQARNMPAGPARAKRMAELNRELANIQQAQRDAIDYHSDAPAAKFNKGVKEAMAFFVGKGWTKEQAAGIVGNLMRESPNLNPREIGDKGNAYGIAQWHADRQAKFKAWVGKDIRDSTLEEQLAFINHELTDGDERPAGDRLRQARTARSAGEVVSRMYERPDKADAEASLRGGLAEGYSRMASAPIPDTGDAGRPGDSTHRVVVEMPPSEFRLVDQRGQQLAQTQVQASARVATPVPAGAQ